MYESKAMLPWFRIWFWMMNMKVITHFWYLVYHWLELFCSVLECEPIVQLAQSTKFGILRLVLPLHIDCLCHNPNFEKNTLPHIIDKEPIELHLHAGSKLGDNLEEPILQQPDTSCLFDRDLTPYYKVFTGRKCHSHYDLIRKSMDHEVKT